MPPAEDERRVHDCERRVVEHLDTLLASGSRPYRHEPPTPLYELCLELEYGLATRSWPRPMPRG